MSRRSEGPLVLGIELGSTRIKAILATSGGKVVAEGSEAWEAELRDGLWTYDLDDALAGMARAYARLKGEAAGRGLELRRVDAIGVSAMMHGYLARDAAGEQLVAFRTWRNTTAAAASAELTQRLGFHIPERWSAAFLYQAVLDKEPHVPRVASLTTLSGYVHERLTGERALSVGDASGMFPIDPDTGTYDVRLVEGYDALLAEHGSDLRIEGLLPRVLMAGECAGRLTPEGALLIDPEGDLEPGCPLCPPEGDAGTGMIATGALEPGSCNVSVGTSIFSMTVLEGPLRNPARPDVDMVMTPTGSPVAMIHCNNCASELDAWVALLSGQARSFGMGGAAGDYERLLGCALEGEPDAGGIVSLPFVSDESVVGAVPAVPLVARARGARLTLPNLMRSQVMAAFSGLALAMRGLGEEGVVARHLYAHGGLFKTPVVAQRLLAGALAAPVTVSENAGEGGAWGQALAAAYMLDRMVGGDESLGEFLGREALAGTRGATLCPDEKDVAGFERYLERYRRALAADRALAEALD